jgi:hypothetical protein
LTTLVELTSLRWSLIILPRLTVGSCENHDLKPWGPESSKADKVCTFLRILNILWNSFIQPHGQLFCNS